MREALVSLPQIRLHYLIKHSQSHVASCRRRRSSFCQVNKNKSNGHNRLFRRSRESIGNGTTTTDTRVLLPEYSNRNPSSKTENIMAQSCIRDPGIVLPMHCICSTWFNYMHNCPRNSQSTFSQRSLMNLVIFQCISRIN